MRLVDPLRSCPAACGARSVEVSWNASAGSTTPAMYWTDVDCHCPACSSCLYSVAGCSLSRGRRCWPRAAGAPTDYLSSDADLDCWTSAD